MWDKPVSLIRSMATKGNTSWLSYAATCIDYSQYQAKMDERNYPAPEGGVKKYLDTVKRDGVCVIEGFWSSEKCKAARDEIERLMVEYPQYINPVAKSDCRIYGANNASGLISEFNTDETLRAVASAYYKEDARAAFTLGAKMPFTPDNLGSGEGWHRDAPMGQFKAIMYLSDVAEDNGPFQFIKDSEKFDLVKLDTKAASLGYPQFRITERQVEKILERDRSRLITYTAKAGTLILADVSAIHRGKPIEAGARYALTNYFYPVRNIDDAMMKKFMVLK